MKLGTVIGRVTLSRSVEALKGGRFLVVSPFSRAQYAAGLDAPPAMGKDPSLVVYDDLGGGVGVVVGAGVCYMRRELRTRPALSG